MGFEIEILALLRKMKAREEVKVQEGGTRRKNSSSKFERELKKLECFVNYKGPLGRLLGPVKKKKKGRQLGGGNGEWDIAAVGR